MIIYIGIVAGVIIFSILAFMIANISIALPLWLTIIPFFLFFGTVAMLFVYWSDNTKYNPEGALFVEARKKDVPLVFLMHLNGFFKIIVGKKEKKGDIEFQYDKDHREGVRVDPAIQSSHVPQTRTIRNLSCLFYGTNSPWAMSTKNALAYQTIIDYVKTNYPQLSFFSNLVLLEYLKKDKSKLLPDCRNLVQLQDINLPLPEQEITEFKQQLKEEIDNELQKENKELNEIELNEIVEMEYNKRKGELYVNYGSVWLAKLFMKIQDEISTLPIQTHSVHAGKVIEGTFFSFAELFQNISSAWSGNDIQQIGQWYEIIGSKKGMDNLKWIIGFAMAFGIIVLMAGLAAYIAGLGK